MPMIVYTEEEMIEAQNLAVADATRDLEGRYQRTMAENTQLRTSLNDLRDVTRRLVSSAELLAKEVADPGTEAMAAIYCAHTELAR